MKAQHALYHSLEREHGSSGFIAHENIFCILEVQDQYTKDEGHAFIQIVKDACIRSNNDPNALDSLLKERIREGNLPSQLSLALGIVKDLKINLKTYGQGQIWLRRGNQFVNLISGNKSGVGPIAAQDVFIFTTNSFISAIATPSTVIPFLENISLVEGIHELSSFIKNKTIRESIALFVKLTEDAYEPAVDAPMIEAAHVAPTTPVQEHPPITASAQPVSPKKKFSLPQLNGLYATLHAGKKNRIVTFALVLIIILILVWSVGFGYKRRKNAETLTRISQSKELITQKLNQSDEVSFLNPQRSLILINEAHSEVESLKKNIGPGYEQQIGELETMVRSREDQITHKENKSGDEFYDLTVDNKSASGSKFSLDGDTVSILDPKNGSVYTLSLEKKSLDKQSTSELKSASQIIRYEDLVYVFSSHKLYKIQDSSAKKVIDSDQDWGTISDIQVYGGNLYFLDSAKDQIYKYIPTDSGFSEKSAYIKSSENASVKGATSIAIDSSVYVAVGDHIIKFTAGVPDEFKTVFPDGGVHIDKVITTKALEKVYVWDKSKGVLYILGKNGAYERQVKSSTFAKADDIIVYNNAAYALQKEKIYKVSVQ